MSGYHDNRVLVGEHPFGHAGQLIFLFLFAAVWAFDSFVLNWSTVFASFMPFYIRAPLGMALIMIAVYLTVASTRTMFMRTGDRPVVVDFGVYRVTRHPMYLGTILFYLGLVVITVSIAGAAVWLAASVFYHFIARHEEKLLQNALGDGYRAYMKRTGMWLPKIF